MQSDLLVNKTYLIRDAWDRQEWNNAIGKKKKNKNKKAKLEAKGKQLEELKAQEEAKTARLKARMEQAKNAPKVNMFGLSKNAQIGLGVAAFVVVVGVAIMFKYKKNP